MEKKKTQIDYILEHMRKHGSINHREAEDLYGIMRLASRINDLKQLEYVIDKKMVSGHNRYGIPVRYAEYSLKE